MDDAMDKIMAGLMFDITGALEQFEILEKKALESSVTVKEAFAKTQLTAPIINTSQLTMQQAMVNQITAEGEARRVAIIANGEVEISAIMAKEALKRQGALERQADTELAIVRQQVEQEKLLYMQSRQAPSENKPTGALGLPGGQSTSMLGDGAIFGMLELLKKGLADVEAITGVYNLISPLTAALTLTTDGLTFAQARQAVASNGAAEALTMEKTALLSTVAATEGATVATKSFSLALIKNPLGLVITGLTAFAGTLLYDYIDKMGKTEMATKSLAQAQQDAFTNAQQTATQMNTSINYLENLKEKHSELTNAINSGKLSTTELAETQKNLNTVNEAVLILSDGKTRALIESNGVTEAEIQLVIESAIASKTAAISKMEDQKRLADESVSATYQRIKALEIENNLWLQMAGNNPIPKRSFRNAMPKDSGGLAGILEAENNLFDAQKQKSNDLAIAIMVAKGEIGKLKNTSDTPASSGGSTTKQDYTDPFKKYIQTLDEDLPAIDDVLADHTNALDLLSTKEAIWKQQTDGLIPSLAQQQEEYSYLTQTIQEYKDSQEDLHSTANRYRAEMDGINTLMAQEHAKLAAGTITQEQHDESIQVLQSEYDKLGKAVSSMSSEWWKDQNSIIQTQKEYDNLDDSIANLKFDELKQKFDNGLISAEQYQNGIDQLEGEFTSLGKSMKDTLVQANFQSILSTWTTEINDALDKAQKKFEDSMDNIDEGIKKAQQGLQDFKNSVSDVFEGVDSSKTFNFSEDILKSIPNYLMSISDLQKENGLDKLDEQLYPPIASIDTKLINVGQLLQPVVSGTYNPGGNTDKELSKDDFLKKLGESINGVKDAMGNTTGGLNNAANQVDAALNDVETWKNSEVRRIDSEIESVKTKLESDVKAITGLFDQLDVAETKYNRETAKGNYDKSYLAAYNAMNGIKQIAPTTSPTIGQLTTLNAGLPGQLDLSNLGNLSAEQFASTISQGLTTLGAAKITAQRYISDLADSTQTQIDAIDDQLKALDEETQTDTRADAEKEHNKKITDLQQKLAYEQARTGQQHLENVKDINRQIADENDSWAETQEGYAREDKRQGLQDQKTSLQKQKDLLTTALTDFVTYINSEIQTRKDATGEYKQNLTDKANADTAALETEKTNVTKRAELLTEMLKGVRQYISDEIAAWKKEADDRTDIEEAEVNNFIATQETLKETLTTAWNDKKTGIVAITRNGVLATLAMMAAMSDGFKTQGMAMVQGLIDGITDKDLKDSLTTELQKILNATAGGVPSAPNTSGNPTAYIQGTNEAVEIRNDVGYVPNTNTKITDKYPGIKWVGTTDKQSGGAWGYYVMPTAGGNKTTIVANADGTTNSPYIAVRTTSSGGKAFYLGDVKLANVGYGYVITDNGDGTFTVTDPDDGSTVNYNKPGNQPSTPGSADNGTVAPNTGDDKAARQKAAHAKADAARAKLKAMGIGDQNGDKILDIDQKPRFPNVQSTIEEAQDWYDTWIKGQESRLPAGAAGYFQDILDARNDYVNAAEGAVFTKPAMTMIAEAGESEVAMPLSKFQPMMDEAVLASLTKTTRFVPDLSRINAYIKQIDGLQAQISVAVNSNFDKAADKIVAAIEKKLNIRFDKLVHVEHYEPQDNTDVETFGREIMRQIGQG